MRLTAGEYTHKQESLFSLANGYLGFRGFPEERIGAYHPGVFINGVYETKPIVYGERAYGYAKDQQVMVDLPDARYVTVYADGQLVSMGSGILHCHERTLDMARGTLQRVMDWEGEDSTRLRVSYETLISYQHEHIGALKIRIEPIRCSRIELHSSIALPLEREVDPEDPRVSASHQARFIPGTYHGHETGCDALFSVSGSRQRVICGTEHADISCEGISRHQIDDEPFEHLIFSSQCGDELSLTKLFFYTDQLAQAESLREELKTMSFDTLLEEQERCLQRLWESSEVSFESSEEMQQVLRFNLFQLYQSAGRDGRRSLAAKGLTGSGYDGHYFWDTEIYALPLFTLTQPETARALLSYRISKLDQARERAGEMSQRGALFPWRTINGEEASAYFPAGTAQYHIDADIAYALLQYVKISGDESIVAEGGAELLFETARFWYDIGFFNPAKGGDFCINEVTGPDEYTALVNNNFYTNVMARIGLREAASYHARLKVADPALLERLEARLGINDEESAGWEHAAQLMHIPFDREEGIHPQDDLFLEREPWDFAGTPKDQYPLLLHFHPLVIYRHQVLKQADVVLAEVLAKEEFPWYERRRDFLFYERLTTGDSSLSACIQGIAAAHLGMGEISAAYAELSAFVDQHDRKGNARDGLHTASMAGSWLSLVYGFAGFSVDGQGRCRFAPEVPEEIGPYSFRIIFRGRRLHVSVDPETTMYTLLSGEPLEILHHAQQLSLSTDAPTKVSTLPGLKAVIFDLDGVITSTDEFHYQAWKVLCEQKGWDFSREVNEHLRGVSRRRSLEIICEHNAIELSEDEIAGCMETKNEVYRESLRGLTPEHLLPGALELIRSFRARGLKIGIASISRNAGFILKQLRIGGLIDHLVPAEEVVKGKPDPEVFVRCADALQVSLLSCAAFEDAQAGIEAITAARMRSIGVGDAVNPAACDIHVMSLQEVSADEVMRLWE